ncbi:S-layer homology domain-containing protein [Anaerobacillus isosaccharinicus]|uniref:S-layer homology domain-containing protein n=1 Tax=Anaerobacillus isosaccharinicus TaxID=1532552 RepID=A0A1S2KZK9_9BACI|nr:S-layer homology domain-containing protein [Anaerobacillus isosaccharinicus]MBA5584506.1 S-layer homology domain-containing protein [Anaerobacillus isosaccharinicus]QOY37110.1 S-layer homology domain-containing protein [Anaerobacillus isosaccharinicus]
MKKYYLTALALILVISGLIFSPVITANQTFKDVPNTHRFNAEISYLSNLGVVSGVGNGNYEPDAIVTRAAAAAMIGRALKLDGTQRNTRFPDVKDGNNASGFIESAAALGIITGFPTGEFRPSQPVTRGQMAIFLSRAFKLEQESEQSFIDLRESMSSYIHVKRILAANITQGYPGGTFRPDQQITRGEFAALLARALDDKFKKDIVPEPIKIE